MGREEAAVLERVGDLLGGAYRLEERIESGKHAETYLGTEVATQRRVVVRILRAELALDARVVSGFVGAAKIRSTRGGRGPAVIAIASDDLGIPFIVEEDRASGRVAAGAAPFDAPDGASETLDLGVGTSSPLSWDDMLKSLQPLSWEEVGGGFAPMGEIPSDGIKFEVASAPTEPQGDVAASEDALPAALFGDPEAQASEVERAWDDLEEPLDAVASVPAVVHDASVTLPQPPSPRVEKRVAPPPPPAAKARPSPAPPPVRAAASPAAPPAAKPHPSPPPQRAPASPAPAPARARVQGPRAQARPSPAPPRSQRRKGEKRRPPKPAAARRPGADEDAFSLPPPTGPMEVARDEPAWEEPERATSTRASRAGRESYDPVGGEVDALLVTNTVQAIVRAGRDDSAQHRRWVRLVFFVPLLVALAAATPLLHEPELAAARALLGDWLASASSALAACSVVALIGLWGSIASRPSRLFKLVVISFGVLTILLCIRALSILVPIGPVARLGAGGLPYATAAFFGLLFLQAVPWGLKALSDAPFYGALVLLLSMASLGTSHQILAATVLVGNLGPSALAARAFAARLKGVPIDQIPTGGEDEGDSPSDFREQDTRSGSDDEVEAQDEELRRMRGKTLEQLEDAKKAAVEE